jgi:hypothetical protein
MRTLAFSFLTFAFATSGLAVETNVVQERYTLVGVIAESQSGKQSGIVVIKDNRKNKNLTLKTGDFVAAGLRVNSIKRNNVILVSGDKRIFISYGGSDKTSKRPRVKEFDEVERKRIEALQDQYIEGNEVVHIYEEQVGNEDSEGEEAGDRARLWRPVRTGDNLRYIIEQSENGQQDVAEAIDDYEDYE